MKRPGYYGFSYVAVIVGVLLAPVLGRFEETWYGAADYTLPGSVCFAALVLLAYIEHRVAKPLLAMLEFVAASQQANAAVRVATIKAAKARQHAAEATIKAAKARERAFEVYGQRLDIDSLINNRHLPPNP